MRIDGVCCACWSVLREGSTGQEFMGSGSTIIGNDGDLKLSHSCSLTSSPEKRIINVFSIGAMSVGITKVSVLPKDIRF